MLTHTLFSSLVSLCLAWISMDQIQEHSTSSVQTNGKIQVKENSGGGDLHKQGL